LKSRLNRAAFSIFSSSCRTSNHIIRKFVFKKNNDMKKSIVSLVFSLLLVTMFAGNVEKTFTFSQVKIEQNGQYQSVTLDHTMLAGLNGEPMLPYHQVAMMLPPGEKAVSIRIIGEALTTIRNV
jgi:hypothetical protein